MLPSPPPSAREDDDDESTDDDADDDDDDAAAAAAADPPPISGQLRLRRPGARGGRRALPESDDRGRFETSGSKESSAVAARPALLPVRFPRLASAAPLPQENRHCSPSRSGPLGLVHLHRFYTVIIIITIMPTKEDERRAMLHVTHGEADMIVVVFLLYIP
ncbi:MAG: hypothetical protein M1837_005052 [Sclerophora amabilis]|nr:MAG: hypothetical protein M1837_005052 [Sclerophora amabilis]